MSGTDIVGADVVINMVDIYSSLMMKVRLQDRQLIIVYLPVP